MPLNSELIPFVQAATTTNIDWTTLPISELRDYFTLLCNHFALPKESNVATRDLNVDHIPIRIYQSTSLPQPSPAIIYLHGGGHTVGNIECYDAFCHHLAARISTTVISVEYRLAPEFPYPAGLEDAWRVCEWVQENIKILGLDPSRLVIAGDSAGGNLAALLTLRARDRGLAYFSHQLLIYPATDFSRGQPSQQLFGEGYILTAQKISRYYELYLPHPQKKPLTHPELSPLFADKTNLPPGLVITAEFDPLRDEGEAYAKQIQNAGTPIKLVRVEGVIHGFLLYMKSVTAARTTLTEICSFLQHALM